MRKFANQSTVLLCLRSTVNNTINVVQEEIAEEEDPEDAALEARRAAGRRELARVQEILNPGLSGWVQRTDHLVRQPGAGASRLRCTVSAPASPEPVAPVQQEPPLQHHQQHGGLLDFISSFFSRAYRALPFVR
jgi:hypothetical protein